MEKGKQNNVLSYYEALIYTYINHNQNNENVFHHYVKLTNPLSFRKHMISK